MGTLQGWSPIIVVVWQWQAAQAWRRQQPQELDGVEPRTVIRTRSDRILKLIDSVSSIARMLDEIHRYPDLKGGC